MAARPGDPADLCLLAEAYRSLGPRTAEALPDRRPSAVLRKEEKLSRKRTAEEEDKLLALTPQGHAALESNQARAEELFKRAASMDTGNAGPHLGLGLLYEQRGHAEARAEYRKYLELAPNAPDKLRVERRIKGLDQHSGVK